MSISALRSLRCIFSVMAVAFFSAVVLVGCGNDDLDSKLICADGEAWVVTQDGKELAYILKGDGSLVVAKKIEDIWYECGTGTWSTSKNAVTGSQLTCDIRFVDGWAMASGDVYTVSGDGKTANMAIGSWDKQTFTKMSGITVQPRPEE